MSRSVLVVDDDLTIRETLTEFFEALGWIARSAATATDARRAAAAHAPDVILVDLRLPDADGLTLLHALRADDPELPAIVLTGHADIPTAVRAMREGALDFLEKPVDLDALHAAAERAAELGRMRRELVMLRQRESSAAPSGTAGSRARADGGEDAVDRLVALAAHNADAPVLLVGETGTGKGYVARRIHELSAQREAAFVEVNCASLAPPFFESELFGHERGAFTDARQAKRGLLEIASGGTVFLDEIGELSLDAQPRLLKVLEERTFRRLGGTTTLRSDARLITATNRPLAAMVDEGRFRPDLFYRLQVLTIELRPLREQPAQLEALIDSFLPAGSSLSVIARAAIQAYAWPGNIRELRNTLWRAALLAGGGVLEREHLGLPLQAAERSHAGQGAAPRSLEQAERDCIQRALQFTGGNRTRAAEVLGIARSTLTEKLKRLNLRD